MACTKMFTTSCRCCAEPSGRRGALPGFDLQLFNQEKTEDATPKRKQEARKKGQVAKSVDLNSAFVILAACFAIKLLGSFIYDELTAFMRFMFAHFSTADLTVVDIQQLFINLGLVFLKTAMPLMAVILVISLAINVLQVGVMFSFEPLTPKLDRINPISGFKRLFSLRSIVEAAKAIFKIVIISYFVYRFIMRESGQILQLIRVDLEDSMRIASSLVFELTVQIGAVILIMAAVDYFYQWWEHTKSLRMSKQEVKDEFKQVEGNPQIKGKIKERQRAMAMRRMMQEVPKATAIITNPTHFAVAVKYEKAMPAPEVVAKGQDFLAERIKTLARENGVAVVENKPLARALYATVEVGEAIPPELYQAVAEVLAHVFRLKKRLS